VSPPLNILYVGTLPPHRGGSAIVASDLLPALAALGHRVRALAPATADDLNSGDDFAKRSPAISVARYLVPFLSNSSVMGSRDRDYRDAEGVQIREKLPRFMAQERPDILVFGRESIAWHIPDIDTRRPVASVLIVHGGVSFEMLTGGLPEASQLIERFARVNLVIAVAEHMAQALRRLGLSNLRTIPNPVDLDRFRPSPKDEAVLRELAIPADAFVILHVSKLTAIKRPLDLIASAEIALPRNRSLIYLIVGDGQCRTAMVDLCRSKGLLENFRFLGWVDHDRMPQYMNLADLVVMPSESEGQSLVCLEAQACGRVVLASDIAGAREVITHGETGLLFKRGQIDDIAEKILWAAENPETRAAIGRRGREAAISHAHVRIAKEYSAALETVAGDRSV